MPHREDRDERLGRRETDLDEAVPVGLQVLLVVAFCATLLAAAVARFARTE
ncbi:MAG: hypothetical protein M3Y73_08060 [Actinomycetota bacterium]|nr:hypothetical protein [Actinomycetota bacterium]